MFISSILDALNVLGYEIELKEINLINRMTIELCKRKIFTCDIRNLHFNMESEDDVVCQRAIAAVKEAYTRFNMEENIPRYTSISKGKRQIENLQQVKCTKELVPDLMYEHPYQWGKIVN